MNQIKPDVLPCVVIGGGAVGATTALLLAKAGVAVTLIDAATPNEYADVEALAHSEHNSRVFALSPASIDLLERAGIWQHVQRRADYHRMQVWFKNGAGELTFGEDCPYPSMLGSMVEPHIINQAVYAAIAQTKAHQAKTNQARVNQAKTNQGKVNQGTAQEQPKAKLGKLTTIFSARAKHIDNISGSFQAKQTGARFSIQLDDGQTLFANMIIGADGRNSFVRKAAGIGVTTLDYQQTAICCAIKTQKPHAGCARQVFLPTGPLALLPLADFPDQLTTGVKEATSKKEAIGKKLGQWQSVVWTLPTNQALDMLAHAKDAPQHLAKALAQASQYVLGDVTAVHSIASFPLNAIHANTYIQDNLALVGDAAHGVHPLAGQGLNLGLLDVAALTDALLSEHRRSAGRLLASSGALHTYQTKRYMHNAAMMHAFSAIGFLFASQPLPMWSRFEWLRSEVLSKVGKSAMLREFFTHQASGLGHRAITGV